MDDSRRSKSRAADARLQALASFLPKFEAPDCEFGRWVTPPARDGLIVLPYFSLSPAGERFVQSCYDHGWVLRDFQWPEWKGSDDALRLRDEPGAIEDAEAADLARAVRSEARGKTSAASRPTVAIH